MTRQQRRAAMRRMEKLVSQLEKGGHLTDVDCHEPGCIYIAEIRHDAWCPVLQGGQTCVCNPERRLRHIDTERVGQ